MSGEPIPKDSFLTKQVHLGAFSGERRWRSEDGSRIYTWDSFHGHIEVYNKRGRHMAVLHADGEFFKGAIKGRKIDV